jgi:hypothetical protein
MSSGHDVPEKFIRELETASKELDERLAGEAAEPSEKFMRILYSEKGPESPFEARPAVEEGLKAYSGDYYGAFSLETFASAGSLYYTHEDAGGWLNYVEQFNQRNFWYKDGNVKIWAYYEQYDNWQDTYGMDAVLAVYHSGHGGMTGDGKFHVPLGGDWGGLGTTAWSDQMRLGNEQVRYIFWSTCLSCRVLDGHSPMRTWSPANLGFRMLFGYETGSVDNPNYGKFFWEEWNKNKSFSTAFLDASWRISHHQAPAVVACGATKDEAIDRVFNERYFYWGSVSNNWWWWRWYYAASAATAARALNQKLPSEILIAELQPRVVDGGYVNSVLARHDVGIGLPREVQAGPGGIFSIQEGDMSAAFEGDGSYELKLGRPNLDNKDQISMGKAVNIAQDFVRQHGLDREGLAFDRIMFAHEGGGSEAGSGQIEGPYITETTVQFTQVINGLPVLLPGKGRVSVTVDNDGTVTSVKNSTRGIDRLTERLKNPPLAPDEERPTRDISDPQRLLAEAWQERMKDWIVRGRMPVQYTIVPGTYEIGYAIKGNEAILVARNDIEVDCGDGYLKRYSVEVPLLE